MKTFDIFPDGISNENKEFLNKFSQEMDTKRIVTNSVYGPYGKIELPAKNRYVRDTPENRKLLSEKFGDSKISNLNQQTYLVIDIESKKWDITFDFQWLYTNQPPLTPIDEILSL